MADIGTPRRQTFGGLLGIRLIKFWWGLVDFFAAFFNISKGDTKAEAADKAAESFVRRGLYFVIDYSLAALFVTMVATMTAWGFSFLVISFVSWAYDLVCAGMFWGVYERSKKLDITLGADFRRATDALTLKSRLAAWLAVAGLWFTSLVWTGPENIIIFYRKKMTMFESFGMLLSLTLIQAVLHAATVVLGYKMLAEWL